MQRICQIFFHPGSILLLGLLPVCAPGPPLNSMDCCGTGSCSGKSRIQELGRDRGQFLYPYLSRPLPVYLRLPGDNSVLFLYTLDIPEIFHSALSQQGVSKNMLLTILYKTLIFVVLIKTSIFIYNVVIFFVCLFVCMSVHTPGLRN